MLDELKIFTDGVLGRAIRSSLIRERKPGDSANNPLKSRYFFEVSVGIASRTAFDIAEKTVEKVTFSNWLVVLFSFPSPGTFPSQLMS